LLGGFCFRLKEKPALNGQAEYLMEFPSGYLFLATIIAHSSLEVKKALDKLFGLAIMEYMAKLVGYNLILIASNPLLVFSPTSKASRQRIFGG